jgi:NAD-dependent SIR2 family protein deacetylase
MSDVTLLVDLLRGRRFVALTGAGCSTDSGIPDYRGPGTRARARNPVQYRAFVDDPRARQRYWARSMLGWPRFSAARPNGAHAAFAALERVGQLRGIITQNVDRLHHAAGSARVVELHGALAEVVCLACGALEARAALQDRLTLLNPWWDADVELAPDGDAELAQVEGFRVADCLACGGVLKPRVVFFGENVPRPTVDEAFALLAEGDALLVAGSSLTVYSGLRFVRRAAEAGVPIAILNLGPTRGDPYATLRVDAPLADTLPVLRAALAGEREAGER